MVEKIEEEYTPEEREILREAGEKMSEVYYLTLMYPVIDAKRISPRITKKLKELKDLLAKVKIKEVV